MRRELWKGNSGHGASQVCHSPAPVPPLLGHLGRGGEVAVHGLLRRRELGGRDHARHNAPPVGVPVFLQLGCAARGHDAQANPATSAIMDVPRAFARRGPFENPDRVGRSLLDWSLVISSFSDLGVPAAFTDRLTRQGITEPLTIQSETHPARPRGPGHLRQGAHRIGQDAGLRHPARRQHRRNRARAGRGRWSSCPRASWRRRCTRSSETSSGHERKRVVSDLRGHRLPRPGARPAQGGQHRGGLPGPPRGPDRAGRRPPRRCLDRRARRGGPHGGHGIPSGGAPPAGPDGGQPPGPPLLGHHRQGGGVDHPHLPAGPGAGSPSRRPRRRRATWPTTSGRSTGPSGSAITAKLIEHHGQAFVFCRTKRGADRVVRQLQAHGVRAVPMHGDRTQGQRERALESFAKGKADALVATDVVARGIHVDGLAVRGPFRSRRRTTSTTCTGPAARAGPAAPGPSSHSSRPNSTRTCMACRGRSGSNPASWRRSPLRHRRAGACASIGWLRRAQEGTEAQGNGEVLQQRPGATGSWSARAARTSSCTTRRSKVTWAAASRWARRWSSRSARAARATRLTT